MSTLFSKIVTGDIPAYKVAENEKFLAFLDIFPLAKGHTLVIPKTATDYIFDIDSEEYSEFWIFAKHVAMTMDKVIDCERIGVAVIGLEVPHVHVHLIPLHTMENARFTHKEKLTSEEFEAIAQKIASHL